MVFYPFFQAQIFCIGNPFVWWVTTLSLPMYFGLLIFYLLRRRRKVYDLSKGSFSKYLTFNLIYVKNATYSNKKVCCKSLMAPTTIETFQAQIAKFVLQWLWCPWTLQTAHETKIYHRYKIANVVINTSVEAPLTDTLVDSSTYGHPVKTLFY